MNKIDFSQSLGDFQLDKRTFEFMQEAYLSLQILGMLIDTESDSNSQVYILSGVVNTSNSVSSGSISDNGTNGDVFSEGWLFVEGKMYKFEGGSNTGSIVKKTITPSLGTPHDSRYKQETYAFGSGVGAVSFSSLKRVPKIMEAAFKDEIRMYAGDLNDLPLGWYICDGQNGTQDFRGRVPVGLDTGDSSINTIGDFGGYKTHTLSKEELPSHTHHTPGSAFKNFAAMADDLGGNTSTDKSGDTGAADNQLAITELSSRTSEMEENPVGSNLPHNNMQPYRVVNYIQFKGYVKP